MSWRAAAHTGFTRELRALGAPAETRLRQAVQRLILTLETEKMPDPRKVFASADIPAADLKPLRGSGIPGSYRLRVGPFRVALVLLPAERLVLLTAVARRRDSTYRALPAIHRRRFFDR